jgi:membrane-bound lytic murein transglycosylase D
MRNRSWWGPGQWLWVAVVAASLIVLPRPVLGWGGEPLALALPAERSLQQPASIPRPPEPPPVPVELLPLITPPPEEAEQAEEPAAPDEADTEAPGDAPAEALGGAPAEAPLALDEPIFEDPRVDVAVMLPAPPYPIVINAQVEALMDYFVARERDRFSLWIARSGRYLGMIRRIFRERGLPEELAYTAMIESGFSPRAVSRVGAKGMWQFMEATGRRYGLTINRWVDERFDPVKATVAAARYLGDLYGMFGHWFLAQAAYNAGEARIYRAIQRARTSDFWALTQTRHLPNETKRFVPQILAAAVITQAPSRYGFDVAVEPPLEYDEVVVKRPLDFETAAALAGVAVDELRDLNPALRGGITPPFGGYALRVPVGAAERFQSALDAASPERLITWGLHRVGRSETLVTIARQYQISPQRLAEINQLPRGRLRGVVELLVPVSKKVAVAPAAPAPTRVVGKASARSPRGAPVRIAERDDRVRPRSR